MEDEGFAERWKRHHNNPEFSDFSEKGESLIYVKGRPVAVCRPSACAKNGGQPSKSAELCGADVLHKFGRAAADRLGLA
jgi:hypothetical protein